MYLLLHFSFKQPILTQSQRLLTCHGKYSIAQRLRIDLGRSGGMAEVIKGKRTVRQDCQPQGIGNEHENVKL